MKEAIQKAIEGGWKPEQIALEHWEKIMPNMHRLDQWRVCSYALLDPLFWQSLGKSLGWEDEKNCPVCWRKMVITGTGWMCHWHRFIDHLASGKDAEEFFNNLLPAKE